MDYETTQHDEQEQTTIMSNDKDTQRESLFQSSQKRTKDTEDLENGYDLQKLWTGIGRHERLILWLSFILGLVGIGIAYHLMTTYEASAIVVYQEDKSLLLPGGTSLPTMSLPTVLDLIQSPANFTAVKKILGVDDSGPDDSGPSIKSMIDVPTPRNNSNFITIFAKGKNKSLVIDVANTVATNAVKASQDFNQKQLLQALESYRSQLATVYNRLNSQLKEIEEFKNQNRNLELTGDLQQFSNMVVNTRQRLEEATLRYHSLEVEFDSLTKAIALLSSEIPIQRDPNYLNYTSPIQARINVLDQAIGEAKIKYAKDNPRLKALEEELEQLQAKAALPGEQVTKDGRHVMQNPIKVNLEVELLKLEGQLRSAKQIRDDVALSYAQLDRESENLPAKQIALAKLLNARDLTLQEIKFLNDAVETTQLMINWPRGSIELYELADKATPRGSPWLLLLPLALAGLGAVLGGIVAILKEIKDDKFRTSKQVELAYGVPCIATIPELSDLCEKNSQAKLLFFTRMITERLDALKRGPTGPNKSPVIGIGSSIHGEGKSVLTKSIAHYYSNLGYDVLLINTCNKEFNANTNQESRITLEQFLRHPGHIDSLIAVDDIDAISMRLKNEPAMKELLKTPAMGMLLTELKKRYQVILIDIPSVIQNDCSSNLFGYSDTRLFIIDSMNASKKAIDESLGLLKNNGLDIQGIILNRVLPLFIKDLRTLNEIEPKDTGFWRRWFPK